MPIELLEKVRSYHRIVYGHMASLDNDSYHSTCSTHLFHLVKMIKNTLGPRQLSVDIDRGVVILEVPEKKYQGTVWRFVSHYSRVLRKYFGLNKVESDVRARANSGTGK